MYVDVKLCFMKWREQEHLPGEDDPTPVCKECSKVFEKSQTFFKSQIMGNSSSFKAFSEVCLDISDRVSFILWLIILLSQIMISWQLFEKTFSNSNHFTWFCPICCSTKSWTTFTRSSTASLMPTPTPWWASSSSSGLSSSWQRLSSTRHHCTHTKQALTKSGTATFVSASSTLKLQKKESISRRSQFPAIWFMKFTLYFLPSN